MSRRDKLTNIFADTSRELAAANSAETSEAGRVLAGPVRTMGLVLDRLDQEARELHEALASGEKVIELDPALIEGSFVRDRLDGDVGPDDDLVKSIETNGQEVPILVRKHPEREGRYQVAYGHRRLKAIRVLGQKVRAVVRPMTDEQLIVAQGIENTARKDLSYIERATFAANLEAYGFGREAIMQALSTDKTELSKMLSVAKAIPVEVVNAVGAAPSAGRRRWMEIAEKIQDRRVLKAVLASVATPSFQALGSDDRFLAVFAQATRKPKTEPSAHEWKPEASQVSAKIRTGANGYSLSMKAAGPDQGFGTYLTERLDELYADWKSKQEH
ncbi:plasmid partitioning protein RepB [Paracoccus denitrificans]|uniref:plasmid partitioning protein RepB n=1 Tax=Paracoccus denitrificans TaxID=266 RepID=UPI000CEB906B|nr:plasmid partitioning protein RepB [Paracoccus denitrificans]